MTAPTEAQLPKLYSLPLEANQLILIRELVMSVKCKFEGELEPAIIHAMMADTIVRYGLGQAGVDSLLNRARKLIDQAVANKEVKFEKLCQGCGTLFDHSLERCPECGESF